MIQTQETDPLPVFSALLRQALGDDLDPAATTFLAMLSEDAVMEFPYSPPGMPQCLEGRAAIERHLDALDEMIIFDQMTLSKVYRTTPPGTVIVEFEGKGRAVENGKSYHQTYISVITLRDGHIAHYRDYWNPLVVLETLQGDL